MKTGLKFIAVWLALMAGQVAAGVLTMAIVPISLSSGQDGPLDAGQALAVVNAAYAMVLGLVAMHLGGRWWQRAAVLFVALYGVEAVQAGIETIYFNRYIGLSADTIVFIFISQAIKAVVAALVAAGLWRRGDAPRAEAISGLAWKIPAIAALYIPVYFIAGELIAWQGAELRGYYHEGASINKLELGALQFARGFLWAGMAFMLVRSLSATRAVKVVLTGAVFSVFLSVSLLFPVSFMPWDVRKMHLIEVGISNLVFGMLAALILLIPPRKAAGSQPGRPQN